MFYREFRRPKRAKVKVFLKLRGKRWANCGLPLGLASGLIGAYIRLFGDCWRASALIVHYPTKIAHFLPFGAIAFLDCLQISVLRRFLGGLFGFIGFRCIFGWLVAFVGLVGLYACSVRRLEVRKRKTCKFIGFIGFLGFIGLLRSCGCFAWFVLLLLRSCSLLGVVVLLVVLFPFGRYDKKKGRTALVLPLFVRWLCLVLSYRVRYYETIAGGFYPQRVTDYPGN